MAAPLTILVPAGNEEANIVGCLESAAWADEVLVVLDAASSDRTEELATPLATRVVRHEYRNSATQKNWAIPQCTHEWVFVLDCDERITPALRAEIERIVSRPPRETDPAAFRVWRANHFLGRPVRYCGWQHDDVTRLFRRDRARYVDRHVHADLEVDGAIGRLRARLLHFTFRSFDQYMAKFERYTAWAARDRAERTPRVRADHLILRPVGRFLKQYVLKQGFRDGMVGLTVCGLSAFSVFMKYARLLEIRLAEGRGEAVPPSAAALAEPETPPPGEIVAMGDREGGDGRGMRAKEVDAADGGGTVAVAGGSVDVVLARASALVALAEAGDAAWSRCVVHAALPAEAAGFAVDPLEEPFAFRRDGGAIVAAVERGAAGAAPEEGGQGGGLAALFDDASGWFDALPDGTVLTLMFGEAPRTAREEGAARVLFAGPIGGGVWHVAHAAPAVSAVMLRGALRLGERADAASVSDGGEGAG